MQANDGIRYRDIVEIATARATWRINYYLEAGYKLLAIVPTSELSDKADGGQFVRQGERYILGRTAAITRVADPPYPTRN